MKSKFFTILCVILLLSTMFAMVVIETIAKNEHSLEWKHKKDVILRLDPTHIWYNYSDYSIYLNTTEYPWITIDLDGDNRTVLTTSYNSWSVDYGFYAMVGTVYITYAPARALTDKDASIGNTRQYEWSDIILGEKYVSSGPEWHLQAGYINITDRIHIGEFFGVTLQNYMKTDYVIKIHNSNGTHLQPITKTFWYSTNLGYDWTQVQL